jgi:hypothetical protein
MNPVPEVRPTPALAAAVVAWHNRHPLAERIAAAQVVGCGVVALPFSAPGAAPLGRVVLAPAVPPPFSDPSDPAAATAAGQQPAPIPTQPSGARRPPGLQAAFGAGVIEGLATKAIGAFALRQGSKTRPGPADWPQRDLPLAPEAERTLPEVRFVYSAAIELGTRRQRVLIGTGPSPQVLGQRLMSRGRRLAAGAVVLSLLAGVGIAAALWPQADEAEALAAPPLAAPAASGIPAAELATGADPGASGPGTAEPAAPPASAAATAAAAASGSEPALAASAPAAEDEARPAPALGSIRPALSDAERELARREAAELRGALRSGGPAGSAAGAAGSGASGQVFAVATPATRTRASSQLRLVLIGAPTTPVPGQPHAEVMETAQGFRAVMWPFSSREEAEAVRADFEARGIPAEVIEF